jgi:CRISPR type II-A-associated protein Csn2
MKQLVYCHLEEPFFLDGVTKYCLVIENPSEFFKVVSLLNQQENSDEEGFVLSDTETSKVLSLKDHSDILIDYFNMDFNNKKIKNLLFASIEKEVKTTELSNSFQKMNSAISDFIDEIIQTSEVSTAAEEKGAGVDDILKLADLHILEDYETPSEMIMSYLSIIYKLKHIDLAFLVNLRAVLPEEKIEEIYRQCSYMKLNIVDIEYSKPGKTLPEEKLVVIDKDLCQIG